MLLKAILPKLDLPAKPDSLRGNITALVKRKLDSEDQSFLPPRSKRQCQQLSIMIPPSIDMTSHTGDDDELSTHDDEETAWSGLSDPDSLFDEPWSLAILASTARIETPPPLALLTAPPIPGLFFKPSLRLPQNTAEQVTKYCLDRYFKAPNVNQVMLFGRFTESSSSSRSSSGLPPILLHLLGELRTMLLPLLPAKTHGLLFPHVPTQARQAILNLYQPGEGISPHIDLLKRYGDGIIGVSFGSGCVMQFVRSRSPERSLPQEEEREDRWDVYLPERSVIILSGEARYRWTHGIDKRTEDFVAVCEQIPAAPGKWISRGVRLSVTFRWLLAGADVVGDKDGCADTPSQITQDRTTVGTIVR